MRAARLTTRPVCRTPAGGALACHNPVTSPPADHARWDPPGMARYLYATLGVALAATTIWCARLMLDSRSPLDFVVVCALGVGAWRALCAARTRADRERE